MQEIYFRPHSNDNSTNGTTLEAWNAKVVEGAKILWKDWWVYAEMQDVVWGSGACGCLREGVFMAGKWVGEEEEAERVR
jgi:hypothetical protein